MGSHALIKAFPGTCLHACTICVLLYACMVCRDSVFQCSSPDRPLNVTSPSTQVHGHMVVTSHTPAKPLSHDLSYQLAHHTHARTSTLIKFEYQKTIININL